MVCSVHGPSPRPPMQLEGTRSIFPVLLLDPSLTKNKADFPAAGKKPVIKIPMNTSSGCLLFHGFSVTRRAFPVPLVPGNQDWGESKSITSERGNFLLKPAAPSDIIHVRALAAAVGRVLPQDRNQGLREQGWGTPAPSPPHLEEGGRAGDTGQGKAAKG